VARFDRVIPPGEEGQILATVDTHKYRGRIGKAVTVRTNDPNQGVVSLQIKANVKSWIDVLPSWQANLTAEQGKGGERTLYLKSHEPDTKLEVRNAISDNPHVKVEVERTDSAEAEKGDYRVVLTLSPDTPPGPVRGTVRLVTSSEKQPEVEITLSGKVFGPIAFFPAQINLAADSSGRPPRLRGTVVFQARPGTEPFRLEKYEADDPRVKLEPMEETGGKVQRLVVTWTAPDAEGLHQGTIRIRTDNKKMAEIEVPYQVRIQGAMPAPVPGR